MEIGIDALPLMGRGGVSRHLIDLLPALLEQGSDHRYHLYARLFRRDRLRRYRRATRELRHPALRWHPVLVPDRLLELAWTHRDVVLPGTHRHLKGLDVFLDTTGLVPAGAPCPVVSVVHDLVPLRFPEWYRDQRAVVLKRLENQVRRSSRIIAVSESTARDLRDILGVPRERIRVVHHGIHPRFRPASTERVEAVLSARNLSRPYFLHVGGSGPVKNLKGLLEGFRRFRELSKARAMLLLGGDLSRAPGLTVDLTRRGIADEVRVLGFIDDEELVALYSGAMAVVVPSRHESFGFPALEAMSCGAAVVATKVGALPEMLGNDVLYFDPDRPDELAELLSQIASDESLRGDLGRRGVARAATFTWSRAARETLETLAEASSDTRARERIVSETR